jgi:S1-C subfamily serine protease
MRKLLLIPAVLAIFVATSAFAQSTRPTLSQLDAEMRSLYGQVAAGTVRVQVPGPTMARLMAPDGHPIHKWSELVDAAVWERLQQLAATHPSVRDDGRAAAIGESRQIEYLDEGSGNTNSNKMIAVLPSEPGQGDFVGVVLDQAGHVAIPAYVKREEAGDQPLRVMAGDERVEATFVGSDRQTNVTVLKLAKPFGTPLALSDAKPAPGALVMTLSPARRGAKLTVWSGGHEDHAVVVDVNGRVAGFARPGQLLAGEDLRFVAGEIIKHGKVKRAQLGCFIKQVQPNDPLRQQVAPLGARPALHVVKVLPNSAAIGGGLQAGDLILSLAGEPVEDIPTFAAAISSHSGPTELKLLRDGKETTVTVNLEPK